MINFAEIGNRAIESISPITKNLVMCKTMLSEISCFIENDENIVTGENERREFVNNANKLHDILDNMIVYTIMRNFAYETDSTTI